MVNNVIDTHKNTWSIQLVETTRSVLENIPATPDGKLHFKHNTKGYAYINLINILNQDLRLINKITTDVYIFSDIDELIRLGWVID